MIDLHLGWIAKAAKSTRLENITVAGVLKMDTSRIGKPDGATLTEALHTLGEVSGKPVACPLRVCAVSALLDHSAQWNRSQFLEVAMVLPRVWFLVLGSLLCAGAVAATAKASKPATAGTFGTRDQLRECLNQDDAIKLRSQALAAAATATSARMSANDDEAGKLADMKKSLDRSDKAAIAAFNQLAVAHNAHVQEVDDDMAKADAANGSLTADKIAMDQDCGSLTYRPADVDAVNRERKKAAAAAVAAASAP